MSNFKPGVLVWHDQLGIGKVLPDDREIKHSSVKILFLFSISELYVNPRVLTIIALTEELKEEINEFIFEITMSDE